MFGYRSSGFASWSTSPTRYCTSSISFEYCSSDTFDTCTLAPPPASRAAIPSGVNSSWWLRVRMSSSNRTLEWAARRPRGDRMKFMSMTAAVRYGSRYSAVASSTLRQAVRDERQGRVAPLVLCREPASEGGRRRGGEEAGGGVLRVLCPSCPSPVSSGVRDGAMTGREEVDGGGRCR